MALNFDLSRLTGTPSFLPDDEAPTYLPNDDDDQVAPGRKRGVLNGLNNGAYSLEDLLYGGDGDYSGKAIPMASPPVAPEATLAKPQQSESALRSRDDYQALREELANRPVETPPKWWQRLGGAAAGFGAGWSNASGHRKPPIDIAAMEEGILHPGYRSKLSEWQSRVQPLQDIATLDRAENDQERRDRQLDISEDWNKSRANAEKQRGLMWAARARAYEAGKPAKTVSPVQVPPGGSLVDPTTGKVLYHNDKPTTQNASGVRALSPGALLVGPDGKIIASNPRTPKEVDPLIEEGRQLAIDEKKRKADEDVEKTKLSAENVIRARRRQEVAKLLTATGAASEDDLWDESNAAKLPLLKAINRRYASQLQGVQNSYAQSIRARHGQDTATDYDVDPDTLEYKPRQAKPAPAAAPGAAPAAAKSNGEITLTLANGTTYTGTQDKFDALFAKRPDLKPK